MILQKLERVSRRRRYLEGGAVLETKAQSARQRFGLRVQFSLTVPEFLTERVLPLVKLLPHWFRGAVRRVLWHRSYNFTNY